jgi:type II secretory pathway pseudopilin PulG
MSGVYKAGFTIIETMLFLAITGFLIIGILAGSGASINAQRYQSSVSNLESIVQGLYSSAANVVNDRPNTLSCNTNAVVTNTGQPQAIGTSDCVIIGRYMTINDGAITQSSVVGYSAIDPTSTTLNDIQLLETYKLNVLPSSTQDSTIDWGTTIEWASSGVDSNTTRTGRSIGILVLEAPASGTLYTFTGDTDDTSQSTLMQLVTGGPTATRTLCLNSNGAYGSDFGIVIDAAASGQNDIQINTNNTPGAVSQC